MYLPQSAVLLFFALSFQAIDAFLNVMPSSYRTISKYYLQQTKSQLHKKHIISSSSCTTFASSNQYSNDDIMDERTTRTTRTTSPSNASEFIDPLTALDLPSPLILGSGSFTRKLILKEMNVPFVLKVKPIDEYEIGIREDESYAKNLVMTLAKAKADALIQGLIGTNYIHHDGNYKNGTHTSTCSSNTTTTSPTTATNNEEVDGDDKFNLQLPDYTPTKEYIVLTADQVVTCNNQILEKPTSIEEAHTFIKQYGNHPPQTVGSVVLTHLPSKKQVSGIDISTISFKAAIQDDCETLVEKLLGDDAPILSCAGGLMVEHPFVKEYIVNIDGSEDGVMGLSKALVVKLLKELKKELDETN